MREKDKKGQKIPSSPNISVQASRRVAGSHGLGEGWKVCSAEPRVFRGPQACLPQGSHSWCLLPCPHLLGSECRVKRGTCSEQGNRKCKKPQGKQVLQRPLSGPGLLLTRKSLDSLPLDWSPPPFDWLDPPFEQAHVSSFFLSLWIPSPSDWIRSSSL